jgi:hypothetical protein
MKATFKITTTMLPVPQQFPNIQSSQGISKALHKCPQKSIENCMCHSAIRDLPNGAELLSLICKQVVA